MDCSHLFFFNEPAPDEGSAIFFLLTTGSSPDLEIWRTPRRILIRKPVQAIAESVFANSEAFM